MSFLAKAQKIREIAERSGSVVLPENIRDLTGYDYFRPIHANIEARLQRFNSLVIHRRFGKSVLAINRMIEMAVECPFELGQYAYCCKTLVDAKRIVWKYLLKYTEKFPGREVSKGELTVTIPTRNGSSASITLYGLDQHAQIRGIYLDGVILDEWAHIAPSVWPEQLRPMLADSNRAGVDRFGRRNQWAIFIFTPFGRNHAHTMHRNAALWTEGQAVKIIDPETGQAEYLKQDDWFAAEYSAAETGVIEAAELENIRKNEIALSGNDAKFRQEFLVSFDAAITGAVYGELVERIKAIGRICSVPLIADLPVHVGIDLGYDDAMAFWFAQVHASELRWINWHEFRKGGLEDVRDCLAQMGQEFGYRYGHIYLPHDAEITEMGPKMSRRAQLAELGVYGTPVAKIPREQDKYPIVRRALYRSHFDAKNCAVGLDLLALYHRKFDEKKAVYSEKGNHDYTSHTADAAFTLIAGLGTNLTLRSGDYDAIHGQKEAEL